MVLVCKKCEKESNNPTADRFWMLTGHPATGGHSVQSATWVATSDRTPPTAGAIKQPTPSKQHQAFPVLPSRSDPGSTSERQGWAHMRPPRSGEAQCVHPASPGGGVGNAAASSQASPPSQQTPHTQRRGRLAQGVITPLPLKPARSTSPRMQSWAPAHRRQERGALRMRSGTDRPPTAAQQERSGVLACTCINPSSVSS